MIELSAFSHLDLTISIRSSISNFLLKVKKLWESYFICTGFSYSIEKSTDGNGYMHRWRNWKLSIDHDMDINVWDVIKGTQVIVDQYENSIIFTISRKRKTCEWQSDNTVIGIDNSYSEDCHGQNKFIDLQKLADNGLIGEVYLNTEWKMGPTIATTLDYKDGRVQLNSYNKYYVRCIVKTVHTYNTTECKEYNLDQRIEVDFCD